jgi:hypothetical protein
MKASNYLPSLLLVNYLNFLLTRHFKKYNFAIDGKRDVAS